MPGIRRRSYIDPENPYGPREGIDWAEAAARGIEGARQGFVQGRTLAQRDKSLRLDEERIYAREREAIQQARREAARKQARQDELAALIDEFRPEQPDPVFKKVRGIASQMEPKAALELIDELGYMANRKAYAEGMARAHGRVAAAVEDGVLDGGRGSELLEGLKSGQVQPGVIEHEVQQARQMAAEKMVLQAKMDEGLALGQNVLAGAQKRPEAQIEAAKKILALWQNGGYRESSLGELEGAMYDALGNAAMRARPMTMRVHPPQGQHAPALSGLVRAAMANPDKSIADLAAAFQIDLEALSEEEIAALEQALGGGGSLAGSR